MQNFCRTKLIATWGPSLDKYLCLDLATKPAKITKEQVSKYNNLYNQGVSVIRFNMSHDSLENHEYRFKQLRKLMQTTGNIIGIMIDTKGPEIRVGKIQKADLKKNLIKKGATVKLLTTKNIVGNARQFYLSDFSNKYNLANDLQPKDKILIEDGKLVLQVQSITNNNSEIITTSLTDQYTITGNRRVNLFNKKYSLPFLSDYDIETITLAVKWQADYLALSFVSNLSDINEVKKIINSVDSQSTLKIICKIETPESIANIEDLVVNTSGIMVARGDLSLEIGYYNVPTIQDNILHLCNKYNRISIVATQMLDSLETKILPTRAEVTDCYYAVKSFSDATMLSGETAAGIDPINAITVMKTITNQAEHDLGKVINFTGLYFQNKFIKKILKQINKRTLENFNILLKGFTEQEIQLISNCLTNRHFFINPDDYNKPSSMTLYKNLSFVTEKNSLNLHLVTKK